MKNKQAFTLIELLVVVLIIGILAAVALPQYQKAVEKSRLATLLPLVKAVANAKSEYFLATGTWARRFDVLSVELPTNFVITNDTYYGQKAVLSAKQMILYLDTDSHQTAGVVTLSDNSSVWLYITNEGATIKINYCEGSPAHKRAGDLCKSLPGAKKLTWGNDIYQIP